MFRLQDIQLGLKTSNFVVELFYFGFRFLKERTNVCAVERGGNVVGVEVCRKGRIENVL